MTIEYTDDLVHYQEVLTALIRILVCTAAKSLILDGGHITSKTRNGTQVNYSITIQSLDVNTVLRRKSAIAVTMMELNE